jgi:hypothetical protein
MRGGQSGQAAVLVLGLLAALFAGTLVLAGFGQALGAKGRHQRAADLAAMSAARVMRTAYPRLFEPVFLGPGVHNPRHLSVGRYVSLARAAAVRAAMRNGLRLDPGDVRFPEETFAPVRVSVALRGHGEVMLPGGGQPLPGGARRSRARFPVAARASAEFVPSGAALQGQPTHASGGGYEGPLAYRMGKPMRPDVAVAFDRLSAAAARAGVQLSITSGYRSDAEQARLFAANPNPKWVAPPGTSLHRYGTELDLGPPAAYGWLAANAGRFGFTKRYSWESGPSLAG